mmetsp:Transcript_13444/g.13504  ORF Transcript_13444/g.13504 Transcript_13444/m.13504 type:complete len:729 (-) Transcript_13444:309-2495(-)|eukprot:CAMPEP_0182422860 /NCGR_PEP_ID=MMETSP1167-20130531/8678_1 /TAXON_ID=2988 /ORGANISM="Mallomonas Sp, Strain CCMP3275" /LENGTH=728 /DNA_ID=CAMNT_0024601291 /DNA_START=64 /DNA_END=2250 /DNA_ORIENTATION=-
MSGISAELTTPSTRCILATCNLSQWALDFDGNLERILQSIKEAKAKGAKYRLGPELEISGYSCEDHFLEQDTFLHCDQSLAAILKSDLTDGILCDIGCPILHNSVRYNCRVFCLNRQIILIRPKVYLPDDGNYREPRFFTSWKRQHELDDHRLSQILHEATGQSTVKFGMAVIHTADTTLASEICEELWTMKTPHTDMFLSGVDIITNGSGSHHQLRKLDSRLSLVKNATLKSGGAYLYSNHRGGDGARLYFDGCAMICMNGQLLAQASQFSLHAVEVITAVIDLNTIRNYRGTVKSYLDQASLVSPLLSVDISYFSLCADKREKGLGIGRLVESVSIKERIHTPEEECALGPACWLWDYLRVSGASGFLLPLSGGSDSASVAGIVRVMSVLLASYVSAGDEFIISHVKRIVGTHSTEELDANKICSSVLHTLYMGTSNSSDTTRSRAQRLSDQIHSYHTSLQFDSMVVAVLGVFHTVTGKTPQFQSRGGCITEDLALQNLQARLRMILAYLFAQLLPWTRARPGFLLVLGSSNVDEALRGYLTKYDCSSADINPIGGICKQDIMRLLRWTAHTHHIPVLEEIATAAPTAELRPIEEGVTSSAEGYSQTDEEDMGMTYEDLNIFGKLRKVTRCGPVFMFTKLIEIWTHLPVASIAAKVKRFFYYYSVNRHKMTTLTPSYHAENYSPDDNRYDLRQFLYNVKWTRQFNTIDELVKENEREETIVKDMKK